MKSSQGTSAPANQPSNGPSNRGRSGTALNDYSQGYRHGRDNREGTTEHQHHGQRSKSTSHHGTHHSTRDGAHSTSVGDPNSSISYNTRGGNGQQRSHSQAKGPSAATRDSNQNNARDSGRQQAGNANAVGHYILGKALGEGTFGKVKLGTHVLTGEKVAVKVLEKSKIKDRKDVERISREIKILKQLHHPNVVQIYEIIETDKDLYLVMEFASGGELFELIVQNQKLKERTASKHLQELLAGVHYIHQLGICHRDLKPENLLIDFDGQLKIVDFGLSNMYEKNQTLKTACGSPCYAAPEMIAGNRYHGLKSDIWSCGVVLYAMLCGYLPFEDQKTSNLYKKIMNADYSLPKFLSADAKDILSKIFVTDPNKRIDIEGLKQHPWYRLYQPENNNYNFHTMKRVVNDKLVVKMEASLGFSTESVQRAVENNKHNHLSATYYLLLKKYATASYKSQTTQRCASVPARVDTRNPEYTNQRRPGSKAAPQNNNSNSDSKQRPASTVAEANSSAQTAKQSSNNSHNSSKYGKSRGTKESERPKVQEPLVVKPNHRREQSANATAGRPNRNAEWAAGRVEEPPRRVDNYGRGGSTTDNYDVTVSKVQHHKPLEEVKKADQKDSQPANTTNMRQHFISPSPEMNAVASRHRNNSIVNQGKNTTANSINNSTTTYKQSSASQGKSQQSKPLVVNIQNIKSQHNAVSTPSQVQTRVTPLPKQNPPKPATSTQPSVVTNNRSVDRTSKPKQSSSPTHHRKTKSTVPEIQKQNSFQPGGREQQHNTNDLVDKAYIEKSKMSQTQKITNLSKSSGQQTRQQSIKVPQTASQTAKVSDLIGNLNMMSQQQTYFDKIKGRSTNESKQTRSSAGQPMSAHSIVKQYSAEQAAGIEGKGSQETVVNVNNNSNNRDSSGIFQSLTNISQRPIIQDINSQNLLRRLESGNSDNQLRQNFASRQSYQQPAGKPHSPNNGLEPTAAEKRKALQVDDPKSTTQANSRLSGISYNQNYFLNQPTSKTPVNGYQTLDTVGDTSSHELKIPVSSDTDRGVSKSIFYGTQRVGKEIQDFHNSLTIPQYQVTQQLQNQLNQDVSLVEYSTDNVRYSQKNNFMKTQSVHGSNYLRSSNQNEKSNKNVTQRAESSNRISSSNQPKISHSTKHQRNPTSIVSKKSEDSTLNSSQIAQRQTHNGFSIPTQQSLNATTSYTTTQKTSLSKFQSLKVSSNPKVQSNHNGPSQTIEHRTSTMSHQNKGGYGQHHTISSTAHKKTKENVHKTRSQSVSGAQKSSNMYTPASHRKGNSSTNQANTLLQSQIVNHADGSQTAHYRCSTASSQNKERRSSQPPQAHHTNHQQLFNQSQQIVPSSHASKHRSSSSTNYQSTLLSKSIEGKPDGRQRNKSRRDHQAGLNTTLQAVANDRQFQSITHNSGANTSILAQQLEDTIMNQSFTSYGGNNTSGNNRYYHGNTSNYHSRKQQADNINQLLNVAETLRQSNYSVRPRQTGQSTKETTSAPKQNNYLSQTAKQMEQQQSKPSASAGSKYHQSTNIQSELKAKVLGAPPASAGTGSYKQDTGARKQQHQSLTNTMKQITDELMQRSSNQQQPQVANAGQPGSHQSYLSDLFQKQTSQTGKPVHQNNSLFLTQNIGNQTQPIGLKSNYQSPTNNQTKQVVPPQHHDLNQDMYAQHLTSYSQRTGQYGKPIDEPQQVLYSQHLQPQYVAAMNQTQPLLGSHNNHNYHPSQHLQQYYNSTQMYQGAPPTTASTKGGQVQQSLPISLLQQHQNTIQQLGGSYTPTSGMPPAQQLAVSIHGQANGLPQQQKPPSVPAPSTSYIQQQQYPNFYPVQNQNH